MRESTERRWYPNLEGGGTTRADVQEEEKVVGKTDERRKDGKLHKN